MNNASYYANNKNAYIEVRKILDSYGLQSLSCSRFKQWWDLPSSKTIIFSGYITLETIVENYYFSEIDDDTNIDFSHHEQALIAVIENHYLSDNLIMFNQISNIIDYLIPESKKIGFLESIEFFTNLHDVHSDIQHQLYFPPYSMPSRFSKQLIIDVMESLSCNNL